MQLYRTGGDAAAKQARLLRREGVVAAAEPDDVRDVDDGVLGEAGDGQEVVDGLAGGGEREARRAVPRHAAAARQRGAEIAAGGAAVGALPALRQEHRHHRVAHGHLLYLLPDALHHTGMKYGN